MPLPLAGLVGGALSGLASSTLLRPVHGSIGAFMAPWDLNARYKAWWDHPFILPEPGMLLHLLARGRGEPARMRDVLRAQGINIGLGLNGALDSAAERAWRDVLATMLSVPDQDTVMRAWITGWITDEDRARGLMREAGGDWDRLKVTADWLREQPSISEITDALVRHRITPAEWPDLIRKAGGDEASLDFYERTLITPIPLGDVMEGLRRGVPGLGGLAQWLPFHRLNDPEAPLLYQELLKTLPGVSDLLRMASRQLFSPEIVGAYGLYSEFPESMRPWFAKLGLDYPVGFDLPAQDGGRAATLPDLYWGITREILPLNAAYMAYQRFRPGAIARFQREVPDLRPFTIADLRYHMQVAGYPPPMRDYLIALSHPPLGRRQITMAVQYGGWDLQRTKDAFLDLGDTEDNALIEAEVALARKQAQEDAWKKSIERRAHTTTVSEIEGMYDEGILDRGLSLHHLSTAGLSPELSTQLLDLSDSRRARGLLREAVRATRTDYLSGALSAAEALSGLGALGIVAARAGELMQIWTIRRSRHRRQASTAQIIRWVGLGRLPFAEGSRRLANLGWSDPDQILLLADAQATRDKAAAREINLAEQADAKRAAELERLAREAQAEHRRLIAEANRVAPRSVLTRWLRAGEISEAQFRDALTARDFPAVDIDRYVEDALRPSPGKTRKVPESGIYPRAPGSRHPALGMVEKMYLTEVISAAQFMDILKEMGYGDEDARRIFSIADLKHGAKGTTEEPPAPAPSS